MKVTVVIPYFQRQPGLLVRALASARRQSGVPQPTILVVDDCSPHPAEAEVDALPHEQREGIRVIRQQNAGPAAARNRGLDAVSDDTDFVAFLDSDDEWLPGHLRNAIEALGSDLDFYFANHREPESTQDEFARHRRIRVEEHARLPRGSNCYRFDRDMVDQIIMANVIETSTVVYRWSRLRELRFTTTFRAAFEDLTFWIRAAKTAGGIAFSTDVNCQYGRGISIWRSSFAPGSPHALPKLVDQRRFLAQLLKQHAYLPAHRARIGKQMAQTRREVMREALYLARRGQPVNWRALSQYLSIDPGLCFAALPITVAIFFERFAKNS